MSDKAETRRYLFNRFRRDRFGARFLLAQRISVEASSMDEAVRKATSLKAQSIDEIEFAEFELDDKTVTAEQASLSVDELRLIASGATRGLRDVDIDTLCQAIRRFIDQHPQPAVTLDEAVERALSATVCDGEDVRFYLRASCIVPGSDGAARDVARNELEREVVKTILTAAGLPALVAECERLRAENAALREGNRLHDAIVLPSTVANERELIERAEQAEARATSEREACAERVRLALDMQSAPGHWIGLAVRAAMDTEPTIKQGGGTI